MNSSAKRIAICCVLILTFAVYGCYSSAQTLNMNLQLVYDSIEMRGQISQSGVGAATFNGKLYVAYNDGTCTGNLWLTYRVDQYNYSTPVKVPQLHGTYINTNPALAVFQNKLYISWFDSSGFLQFASTTDGATFVDDGVCTNAEPGDPYQQPWDSPSMAVLGSTLYVGFRTENSGLGICAINDSGSGPSGSAFYPAGFVVGDSPGLGTFNGKLYIAYKDNTGSNYIYLGETTDGVNFTFSSAANFNHTSSKPSVAVYNNVLYIGYRQNSSSDGFYYTYSTDGVSFHAWETSPFNMGGPPSLVVGPDGLFYNIFSQNDSTHYLCTAVN